MIFSIIIIIINIIIVKYTKTPFDDFVKLKTYE